MSSPPSSFLSPLSFLPTFLLLFPPFSPLLFSPPYLSSQNQRSFSPSSDLPTSSSLQISPTWWQPLRITTFWSTSWTTFRWRKCMREEVGRKDQQHEVPFVTGMQYEWHVLIYNPMPCQLSTLRFTVFWLYYITNIWHYYFWPPPIYSPYMWLLYFWYSPEVV